MSNPGGGNQFGNYTLQPGYGDVQRQQQLLKQAPMSGAPRAANAIGAPRRLGKQAQRPRAAQAQQAAPVAPPTPQVQTHSQVNYQSIAQTPGASPLVQQIFGQQPSA